MLSRSDDGGFLTKSVEAVFGFHDKDLCLLGDLQC